MGRNRGSGVSRIPMWFRCECRLIQRCFECPAKSGAALLGCAPARGAFRLALAHQAFPTRVRPRRTRNITASHGRTAEIRPRGRPEVLASCESLPAGLADAFGGVFHGSLTHGIPFDFAGLLLKPS